MIREHDVLKIKIDPLSLKRIYAKRYQSGSFRLHVERYKSVPIRHESSDCKLENLDLFRSAKPILFFSEI